MTNSENIQEAEVQAMVADSCNNIIKQTNYDTEKVNSLTEAVIEDIIKKLADRKKDTKYLVSAVIAQKLGAGCHSAITSLWDVAQDNYVVAKWESPSFYVVVTVFGVVIDK